ncbi:MAG: tyrosine-protein phosphatase [Clostridiales bacterium]|nr:tyrosine-protein phosphatase [Clostridiales bacterium]
MSNYNPDSQRLIFDDLINCRELGGMPGADGHVFRNGILLRSGSPSLASPKACRELKEYGVRTVVDLRSKAEVLHYGNPFRDDPETRFYNIPLFVGDPDAKEDPTMTFLQTHTMGDFYVMMLQSLGHEVVKVMRVFITDTDGITLFHCAHGKDRTGVIAALLYLLIGASGEDIVNNYKVSMVYAKDFLDPLIEACIPMMRHTLRSDAQNMETMLDYMQDKYELKAERYLTEYGMTIEEIDALKARITL